MESNAGDSMNGLTAASVDGLVDAIKKTHANCLGLRKFEAAHALADVLFVIHRLREESRRLSNYFDCSKYYRASDGFS
jgi:hypothetical protein